MTKKLRKLLDEAPVKTKGTFREFMAVSDGIYGGFWGINGFDQIVLLGKSIDDDEWYRVAEGIDKFDIRRVDKSYNNFNLDILTDYGIPRIYFDTPIEIDFKGISTCVGEVSDGQK